MPDVAPRRIMIVGNGDIPDGAAAFIDDSDTVIRFNDCRSFGAGGRKTDVVAVCNTGRPAAAMLTSEDWMFARPLRDCTQIWSVRDPQRFAALRAPILAAHPELDDFCDDYTHQFEALCAATGKRHRIIGGHVHDGVDASLAAFSPDAYVVPSSGMIVIADQLATLAGDDEIWIAGFSHSGWHGHPFAAEARLVDRYVRAGRLQRVEDRVASPAASAYISSKVAGR